MSAPLFNRVCLIGMGLIGSSISHAMRRDGLAHTIVGHSPSEETRRKALRLGIVSETFLTAGDAVQGADLIVLCAPVGAYRQITAEIAPHLAPGAIVHDVGSVKGSVVREVSPLIPPNVHFVPGHPIAGTEQSGPEAGFADLFRDRWCILTPLDGCDPGPVARVERLWRLMGSKVEVMSAEHHDMVLAVTSHLPHLIAFSIVNTASHLERVTDTEVIKYSAGGFRDFTRIAASDPTMWRDIFLSNRTAVLEMLGRFTEDLTNLQRAIRYGDGEVLLSRFTEARRVRREVVQAGQDTPSPDFGRRDPPSEAAPVEALSRTV
jgi:cyclohexadieny/prephenate dehydrogenase